jgi:hypothetical protein
MCRSTLRPSVAALLTGRTFEGLTSPCCRAPSLCMEGVVG